MQADVQLVTPPECTLLGGAFNNLVQVGLAAAAVITLIYKRQTERPRRLWIVWAFDASKQAWAGLLQHLVNLAFGMLFASVKGSEASECAWYLLNFAISVACGIFILHFTMKLYKWVVERWNLYLLRSGDYGTPPNWKPWLAQLLAWGFLASAEKLVTAAFVIIPLHPYLDRLGAWVERPLRPYPHIELLVVMVAAPVLLNILFFWAIDNIIMRKRCAWSSLALRLACVAAERSSMAGTLTSPGTTPRRSSRTTLAAARVIAAALTSRSDGCVASAPRGHQLHAQPAPPGPTRVVAGSDAAQPTGRDQAATRTRAACVRPTRDSGPAPT